MILVSMILQHQRRCRHQAKSHIEPDSSAGFVRRFRLMHAPSPQIFPGRPEFSRTLAPCRGTRKPRGG